MRGDMRERILRVILNSTAALSKNELSKKAECSRPWVIAFLKQLQDMKLAKGTEIIDKKKLVEYWLSISRKPRRFRSYMVKEPMELLKKVKMPYSLTTYSAENIVQHYLFPSRIDVYIKESDLSRWHSIMTKNGLYGKGNVRVIITDEHVMYGKRKINNLWIVSLSQLIIDLINEGGPCHEAGEMLIKRI